MRFLQVALAVSLVATACAAEKQPVPQGYALYTDSDYHFSIVHPEDLKPEQEQVSKEIKLIRFKSDGEDIVIFVGSLAGDVDAGKIPEALPKLMKVGTLVSKQQELFRTILEFDKNESGYFTRAMTDAREGNFYIVASFKKTNSFGVHHNIVNSFRITKPFGLFTLVSILGFVSLLLHVVVLNYFFFDGSLKRVKSGLKKREFKSGGFWWHLVVVVAFVAADMFILQRLFSLLFPFNLDGLYVMTVQLSPYVFTLAGEFLAEVMAAFIGFGFWPGGTLGVVLTTIVSCIVNGFEVPAVLKKAFASD